MKQNVEGELHLIFDDAANCSLLRQKENLQLLTEYALDFFQKPLKVRFILPDDNNSAETQDQESPQRIRQELANDPLVIMTSEIFTGEIGDIRVGPRSR
jgi:DNA polymerase-3 subunit gamma/tau